MTVKQAGIDRREFLGAGAALAGLAALPSLAGGQERTLRGRVSRPSLVGAAHPQTEVWTYDGAVPGPELRFRQGERLRVELENLLPGDTTVHWHGVRVPNGMDGVPGLTQPPIKANGGRFVYEFALPDAGTYWYHPHLDSSNQVGRGVYAPLIVEEPQPPAVDRDVVWMLGDWRLDRQARIVGGFGNFMDGGHERALGKTGVPRLLRLGLRRPGADGDRPRRPAGGAAPAGRRARRAWSLHARRRIA